MVQVSGGSTPSFSISHAIAVAPTCAQGSAISRARISSTMRSVSWGVLRAWFFGARERS